MTSPIVGGGSATLAPAKKSSVPKDPKEEKGGIKYAECVASRRPRLEVEASLMQYGALPAAASSIAHAPVQDPLLLIPGPYVAIPAAHNQEPAHAQQPPVGAQNSQVPNPIAQPAPQQLPLAAPLPAAVGGDAATVIVAPASDGVVVQIVQQEPAPVQAQVAPPVVIANPLPQNPVAQPVAQPAPQQPLSQAQPVSGGNVASGPAVGQPAGPQQEAPRSNVTRSCFRAVFDFGLDAIRWIFSCICFCFRRSPNAERRRVAQQPVRRAPVLPRVVIPVSELTGEQAKLAVRDFLRKYPTGGGLNGRLFFWSDFRLLPRDAQAIAKARVNKAHPYEIERRLLGQVPGLVCRDPGDAIDHFIRLDPTNSAVREALRDYCEGNV